MERQLNDKGNSFHTSCDPDQSKGASEIDTQRRSSANGLTKKRFLLFVELAVIVALVAAGFYLWQTQRELSEELRWAQQAEASINGQATVTDSGSRRPADGGLGVAQHSTLPASAEVQRVRIPAVGIDYRLQPETVQQGASSREAVAASVQLDLPVDVYGEGVCGLDRLQPGDTVYLVTGQGAFAYEVYGKGQSNNGDGSDRTSVLLLRGYPCGNDAQQVLVSATSESH